LTDEDIGLVHKIWLEVSKVPARQKVHHRDVVRVALERLERDMLGQSDVMLDFYRLEHKASKGNGVRGGTKDDAHDVTRRKG
jgi:hypothetical protein